MFVCEAVCFIGSLLCPLVSAVFACGMRAEITLFCKSARPTIGIHGNSNAVVFPEIGADGFWEHTGVLRRREAMRGESGNVATAVGVNLGSVNLYPGSGRW